MLPGVDPRMEAYLISLPANPVMELIVLGPSQRFIKTAHILENLSPIGAVEHGFYIAFLSFTPVGCNAASKHGAFRQQQRFLPWRRIRHHIRPRAAGNIFAAFQNLGIFPDKIRRNRCMAVHPDDDVARCRHNRLIPAGSLIAAPVFYHLDRRKAGRLPAEIQHYFPGMIFRHTVHQNDFQL